MSESELQGGDLIRYRTLTRNDFRGPAPTGPAANHVDKVGAQSFVLVKHDPGLEFARKSPTKAGEKRIIGRVQKLHFRAWMDRSRSWWNPKPRDTPETYVLEHEQIHFALVELEAAAMNQAGRKLMQKTFAGDDEKKVQADVEEAISAVVREGMERLLETNRDFDEETSARHDPKQQNAWWQRVQRELAAQK
jgi:hypothetical protein